jgi:hypothetical protein
MIGFRRKSLEFIRDLKRQALRTPDQVIFAGCDLQDFRKSREHMEALLDRVTACTYP